MSSEEGDQSTNALVNTDPAMVNGRVSISPKPKPKRTPRVHQSKSTSP